MELTIKGTPEEIEKALHAISSSTERVASKNRVKTLDEHKMRTIGENIRA